jgi:F-type H+-transporting ATPase subunit epsilon
MSLHLEIISPEKMVYKGEAELVVIPGEEGDFGVMPKHSPIVAQLREGEVMIYADANATKLIGSYTISGGYAQTDGVTCTILSDEVTIVDNFHPAPAHERNSDARAQAERDFLGGN